jgi:hypothetical protein
MGLGTSYDCWSGAYSAFNRWRDGLAKAAGYAIQDVKWDDGMTVSTVLIDWGHITSENLMGEWKMPPGDALIILIAHSDCEGVIKHEHCAILADRLEELLSLLPAGGGGGHIRDWRETTQTFIKGLRQAHLANGDVEFY